MLKSTLLAAALALCPEQDAKADKPISLAHAVPKDALFLVQATRLDALRADFEASAWYAFWKDEEMKAIRDWFEKKVEEAQEEKDEDHGGLGVDPLELFDSVHGSIACFGVLQQGFEEPAMGILVEPGEPRGSFEDHYAKIVARLKSEGIPSSAEYGGIELTLVESRHETAKAKHPKHSDEPGEAEEGSQEGSKEQSEGLQHAAVFDGGGFACFAAAGTREGLLEIVHGMIDRASGKDPSNGIEANAALTQARASVPAAGRLEAFVDVQRIVEKMQADDPPTDEQKQILEALGLPDLRWLYATADVGKGEAVHFDMSLRLPDAGYLREWIDCFGALPREMAGMAPRASTAISLGQFDVWALWQSAWKMAAEMDPESAEGARAQMNAALQQMGGADIEKDFLSQIDGRFASFNVPVPEEEWKAAAGAFAPASTSAGLHPSGNATIIGLRDAAAVAGFVEDVLTGVGIIEQVETEEFQGSTIHKLAMGPGAGVQWAFTKKAGVVSQFPTALRAALRMEGAEAKESALEKESFKPLLEANADASMLGLATTAESIKGGLTALQTMVGAMGMGMAMAGGGEGGKMLQDLPLAHLPSGTAVDRHFKGTVVTSLKRKGGVFHVRMSAR